MVTRSCCGRSVFTCLILVLLDFPSNFPSKFIRILDSIHEVHFVERKTCKKIHVEETLAVLSLRKLFEENGCSCECVSGQKARLTKHGKTLICKTDNFVPLVVRGLSTSSGASSSSTSPPQDLSSTSPAQERSDEAALGNLVRDKHQNPKQHQKMDDNRDADDRLRHLPEWLEEFADNLEDTEVHAPAHISQDSDSQRPAKVVSKSRKHSIYSHCPRDRNCEVCLRTKLRRAPCRRRPGEALHRAKKFGDLRTTDHKVFDEDGESRNHHWYAVVVQDLATQWIQSYQCKRKTSQETERSLRKCPRTVGQAESLETDNALACEELSWNHCAPTPHRSEASIIAERAVRTIKEGTSAVWLGRKVVGGFHGVLLLSAKS